MTKPHSYFDRLRRRKNPTRLAHLRNAGRVARLELSQPEKDANHVAATHVGANPTPAAEF